MFNNIPCTQATKLVKETLLTVLYVLYTHEKVNLSMETCQGSLVDRTVRTVYTRESKVVKETLLTRLTVLYVLYTHEKKVNLSRETCQGNLVDRTVRTVYTREESKLVKGNLSRKTCSSARGIYYNFAWI